MKDFIEDINLIKKIRIIYMGKVLKNDQKIENLVKNNDKIIL